jgi:cytochrome b
MREVVGRLRAEGSEVAMELEEVDHALEGFRLSSQRIAVGTQDLHVATTNIVTSATEGALAWGAVEGQPSRLNAWVSQYPVAFQQLQGAVQAWSRKIEPHGRA